MNRIDASIEFSYQGETYHPKLSIHLDDLMQNHHGLPDLHRYLANQSGIDTYSYLYEVMESHPIVYSNATGLAQQCLVDGQFDLACFEQLWHAQQQTEALSTIAHTHMGVDNLSQHPKLHQALLEAYRLGQQQASN